MLQTVGMLIMRSSLHTRKIQQNKSWIYWGEFWVWNTNRIAWGNTPEWSKSSHELSACHQESVLFTLGLRIYIHKGLLCSHRYAPIHFVPHLRSCLLVKTSGEKGQELFPWGCRNYGTPSHKSRRWVSSWLLQKEVKTSCIYSNWLFVSTVTHCYHLLLLLLFQGRL